MKIQLKASHEIEKMRISGRILAETLEKTKKRIKPGVSTLELDQIAEENIIKNNATSAFKGYNGFPATLCTAINDEIVHGIPKKNQIIKDGDLVTIDCGVIYEGFYTDAARSVVVGKNEEAVKMLEVALKALKNGLKNLKPGSKLRKVSKAIGETINNANYHIIYDLTGHGIGRKLHEPPIVANYVDRALKNPKLKAGMTMAIEPIFAIGTSEMITENDGWTIKTADGSLSIQVEETVLITDNGAEILTKV